jgi:hydrogenase maturation factor HypE
LVVVVAQGVTLEQVEMVDQVEVLLLVQVVAAVAAVLHKMAVALVAGSACKVKDQMEPLALPEELVAAVLVVTALQRELLLVTAVVVA